MAIIPIEELPASNRQSSSSVVPVNDLPVNARRDSKSIFRESLKQVGRSMAGTGLSEFVPGLESGITKAGSEAGMQAGKDITNGLHVPTTPNANVKFAGLQANINPNSVSSMALGSMLDPRSLLGGVSITGPGKAVESAGTRALRPGALRRQSGNAIKEAEKLTSQLLQPNTTELAEAVVAGRPLPSIQRAAENIRVSKTFDDVVKTLKTTTKELFDERRMIFDEYNAPIGNEALDSLDELAKSAAKDMVMSPSKMRQIDNVYYREAKFLEENPNMDVIAAQARKEKLQELTRPLIEKRRAGNLTGAESAELQAYDALRSGYRNAILKALPRDKAAVVDKINSKYEGLVDATELASQQVARGMKEIPKTLLDNVAASFGLSPQYTAVRLTIKKIADMAQGTTLKQTSSKIVDLRNRAETLRQLSKLAKKVKS